MSRTDWTRVEQDILSRLDLAAEAAALGIRFTAGRPNANGWREAYAIDREEQNPSAAVNVASDNGTLGRYTDLGGGEERAISFFELAARLQPSRFADFRAAREHYARQAGVELPSDDAESNGRAGGSESGLLSKVRWHRADHRQHFAEQLAEAKPGVTAEQILRCRVRTGTWPKRRGQRVIAFAAFDPADWQTPCGLLLYRIDGARFAPCDRPRLPERKAHLVGGSRDGLIIVGSVEELAEAETVWKCEGVPDALALAAHLPAGHVAVANVCGAKSFPAVLAEAFQGSQLNIIHDPDDAGGSGARVVAASCFDAASAVRIIHLPDDEKDVRDLIREGRAHEILQLGEETEPLTEPPDVPKQNKDDDPGIVKTLSDLICEENHFAQDAGGKMYRYADGTYKAKAENYVKRRVKRLCEGLELTSKWSTRLANEVVEYIRVDAPELWERPPIDRLNLKNGILHVDSRELQPHTPEYLSTVQLPVDFDPEATCPAIERFVGEVFPEDAMPLAWEVPAWLMLPYTSIQKAVLLVGQGGEGKSRYLAAVRAFLGRKNTASTSLHKLEESKFAKARIIGKLANICPDLPSSHLATTSTFKELTGSEPQLEAERKFKDSFEFEPFCRLIFSANQLPQAGDASEGFFDRWLVVPFDRGSFRDTANEIPSDVLDARLSAPAEMSGFLNKALDALPRLRAQRGFTRAPSLQRAHQEFRSTTDPFAVWLERNIIRDANAVVAKNQLRIAYNEYTENAGRSPMSNKAFGTTLKRHLPDLEDAQRMLNGRLQWVYVGIGLRSNRPGDSLDSRDSRDIDTLNLSQGNLTGFERGEIEQGAPEIERGYRVNRVNSVNGDTAICSHDDREETTDASGWIRTTCRECGRFLGRRPATT